MDGHFKSKKITVQTDVFADYVFEKEYDLMPLPKLQQYIDTNQHLPKIPKGAHIIKMGLNVGELAVLHTEKIEELTLYILQMNKRLEQIEKENKQLKKALKSENK